MGSGAEATKSSADLPHRNLGPVRPQTSDTSDPTARTSAPYMGDDWDRRTAAAGCRGGGSSSGLQPVSIGGLLLLKAAL